jgi:hypothetical protein
LNAPEEDQVRRIHRDPRDDFDGPRAVLMRRADAAPGAVCAGLEQEQENAR